MLFNPSLPPPFPIHVAPLSNFRSALLLPGFINLIKYGGIPPLFLVFRYISSLGKLRECGLKYFLNCYIFFASYNRFVKTQPENVLVVDQGFVQSLISIIYQDDAVVNKEMKKLIKLMFNKHNILVVNCISDGQMCAKRIENRGQNGRVDQMDKSEYAGIFEKQQKNFSLIREHLNSIDVCSIELDMNISVDENCEILYNYVRD